MATDSIEILLAGLARGRAFVGRIDARGGRSRRGGTGSRRLGGVSGRRAHGRSPASSCWLPTMIRPSRRDGWRPGSARLRTGRDGRWSDHRLCLTRASRRDAQPVGRISRGRTSGRAVQVANKRWPIRPAELSGSRPPPDRGLPCFATLARFGDAARGRLRHSLSRPVRRRSRRIRDGGVRLHSGRSSTRCGPSPRPGRAPTASAKPSALTPSTLPADPTPSSARSASTPTAIPSSSSSPSTRSTHRRPAGRATGSSTSSRTTARRPRSGHVRRRDSILRGSGGRMRLGRWRVAQR